MSEAVRLGILSPDRESNRKSSGYEAEDVPLYGTLDFNGTERDVRVGETGE
jgi:hypothetical protein